jgi:hypothetical protein
MNAHGRAYTGYATTTGAPRRLAGRAGKLAHGEGYIYSKERPDSMGPDTQDLYKIRWHDSDPGVAIGIPDDGNLSDGTAGDLRHFAR